MPRGGFLINVARGGLADYEALYAALASGQLAERVWTLLAGADRSRRSAAGAPQLIATPHIAGVTDRSYNEIADAVSANIERLRRREPPLNRVA